MVDVSWKPVPFGGMADVARVAEAFEDGATLVVQALHHWWPPLGAFCRSLESSLGHPTQANAYYTPRSAQGLPVHHDTHDVFCLQISGEKRWLVYEPVLEAAAQGSAVRREHGAARRARARCDARTRRPALPSARLVARGEDVGLRLAAPDRSA